jgi:hypothetical protein
MQVVAFAASLSVVVQDRGGVRADGFPMTGTYVDSFPEQITVPLVLAVYTRGGSDYDPRQYIVATSPDGERLRVLECSWHWPDQPGIPVKYWVLAPHLTFVVKSPGVYSVGLYDTPDATETDHQFLLPVLKANPLLPPPPQASTRNQL